MFLIVETPCLWFAETPCLCSWLSPISLHLWLQNPNQLQFPLQDEQSWPCWIRIKYWRCIFSSSSSPGSSSSRCQRSYLDYFKVDFFVAGSLSCFHAGFSILFQWFMVGASCWVSCSNLCYPLLASQLVSCRNWFSLYRTSNVWDGLTAER